MLDSLDQFSKSWASSKEASEGFLVFGYHYEVMDLTYLYINRLQLLSLSVSKLSRERRNTFWLASEFYGQMSLAAFRRSGVTRYSSSSCTCPTFSLWSFGSFWYLATRIWTLGVPVTTALVIIFRFFVDRAWSCVFLKIKYTVSSYWYFQLRFSTTEFLFIGWCIF